MSPSANSIDDERVFGRRGQRSFIWTSIYPADYFATDIFRDIIDDNGVLKSL